MLLRHYDQPCAAVTGICDSKCDSIPSDPEVKELVNGTPVVTFNEYSAAIYRRHGVRVDAIIPHGIDVEMFQPDYDKRDGVSIVTSSAWAIYPTKGMHILRRALEITGRKAKLISGVSREQVRNELQKASIFVFPSCYEETFGLCLTEAMACGCACVASDVCGPRAQIKHEETGLLVPPRDPQALSDAIEWLIHDGEMRDDMGLNACIWARENCNLGRMGKDYEAFYRKVIDG
jgi:glycosyltransferase involved in cell wall biosynthesis